MIIVVGMSLEHLDFISLFICKKVCLKQHFTVYLFLHNAQIIYGNPAFKSVFSDQYNLEICIPPDQSSRTISWLCEIRCSSSLVSVP